MLWEHRAETPHINNMERKELEKVVWMIVTPGQSSERGRVSQWNVSQKSTCMNQKRSAMFVE